VTLSCPGLQRNQYPQKCKSSEQAAVEEAKVREVMINTLMDLDRKANHEKHLDQKDDPHHKMRRVCPVKDQGC